MSAPFYVVGEGMQTMSRLSRYAAVAEVRLLLTSGAQSLPAGVSEAQSGAQGRP